MKKSLNKIQFIEFLKKTAAIGVLSISLATSLGVPPSSIGFSSPAALRSLAEKQPDAFPEGTYLVEYEENVSPEEPELKYEKFIAVITKEVRLAQDPRKAIGGRYELEKRLADYTTVKIETGLSETNPFRLASYWVAIPENSAEFEELMHIVKEWSVVYVVPDGTGTINLNNLAFGGGLHKIREIS